MSSSSTTLVSVIVPICNVQKYLAECLESILAQTHEELEVIDSFFEGAPADAKPLWYLGESLKLLGTADFAVFAPGWQDYRGCRIEHDAAVQYGIPIVEV